MIKGNGIIELGAEIYRVSPAFPQRLHVSSLFHLFQMLVEILPLHKGFGCILTLAGYLVQIKLQAPYLILG